MAHLHWIYPLKIVIFHSYINDVPIKTSIHRGFSMAMFDYRRVFSMDLSIRRDPDHTGYAGAPSDRLAIRPPVRKNWASVPSHGFGLKALKSRGSLYVYKSKSWYPRYPLKKKNGFLELACNFCMVLPNKILAHPRVQLG